MKKYVIGFAIAIFVICCFGSNRYGGGESKDVSMPDVWAAVAQNAVREGTVIDMASYTGGVLYIDCALTSTTAHTGTKFDILASPSTSGDTDWYTLYSFYGPTGTANNEALGGTEAAGSTVLEVASTTGLYDDDGTRFIFILDNSVTSSEMCYLLSHVNNTSVTVKDGTTNAHTTADTLYDIAERTPVNIPKGINRVQVIADNTYDSDGSQVHTRTMVIKEK